MSPREKRQTHPALYTPEFFEITPDQIEDVFLRKADMPARRRLAENFRDALMRFKKTGRSQEFFFGGGGQLFSDEHSSVDSIKKIRLYDNFRTLTHLKRKLLLLLGAKINGSAPDIVYKCPCDAKKAQKIGKSQGAIRSFKIN